MSVLKDQKIEVSDFQFGSLVPEDENLSPIPRKFEFQSLDEIKVKQREESAGSIRSEREFEAGSSFNINPIVREHRGLVDQEKDDFEKRVANEVEKRVAALSEKATEEGFRKGEKEGYDVAFEQAKTDFGRHLDQLVKTIESLQKDVRDIFDHNKDESYRILKNLTKWVVLKEVDEKYYLSRLLEKLIHEIHTKSNLTIRVNEESFGYMPEMIKLVERKVGKLTNVRIETDLELEGNGIVLESENSIVDGSLEAQMKSIDRLFEGSSQNG